MPKKTGYIILACLVGALVLGISGGCHDGDDGVVIIEDDVVTFVNDFGEPIVVQPFDVVLVHGDAVDFDIGNDIVHAVVFREADGLVLLDTDVEAGDVWIIQ